MACWVLHLPHPHFDAVGPGDQTFSNLCATTPSFLFATVYLLENIDHIYSLIIVSCHMFKDERPQRLKSTVLSLFSLD